MSKDHGLVPLAIMSSSKDNDDKTNGGAEVELANIGEGVPEMTIVSQGSVALEHWSKNGVQKQVYIVVKNNMFPLELSSNVDLSKCAIEAKLIYDYDREDDEKMEVSYVKNEPLEYKVNMIDGGFKAFVEVKIKVLTSQVLKDFSSSSSFFSCPPSSFL